MIACAARVVSVLALLCVAGGVLAGCTSDGDGGPTSAAPSSGSTSVPDPTGAPSRGSSAPLPGLGTLAGTYLVLGQDADTADLYRVARSGTLERITRTGGITAVSEDDGTVVVGRDRGGRETVARVQGTTVTELGLGEAFSPALSDDGALAWVSVGPSRPSGGISKPGGFVVSSRPSPTGSTRKLATFTGSVGTLAWSGDELVVPVANGPDARVVAIGTDGRSRTVARVPAADDLVVTAGDGFATVQTTDGAVVVGLQRTSRHDFPAGWTPLCWPDDDEVLAARDGRLAVVAISSAGVAGTPRVLGPVPSGLSAFAGSCS